MPSASSSSPPAERRARGVVSWSGGKDSCLALLRACDAGLACDTLLTMMEPSGPSKSHALPATLLRAQARAMRMRWRPVRAPLAGYGEVFAGALRGLRDEGHGHVVFGDIDLQAHRDWLEPVCRDAGLTPVFPLWGEARRAIAEEVIARGIVARLVCVDVARLPAELCGAPYDAALLRRLPEGVCPCGEEGEFHTFVSDAPCFVRPLTLRRGRRRRVWSAPPLAPTELLFEAPVVAAGA